MTLQEILSSFDLSDDQITQINEAVDGVIETKLAGKDDEIKALEDNLTTAQGDLASANEELTPVRAAAQTDKLASLMPEDANPDMYEDIATLAGLSEDDDDETIKSKLADTVSSRAHLKKPTTDDAAAGKVSTEVKKDDANKGKPEDEKTQKLPGGVK